MYVFWDTESCHYTGHYNPRRYSKEELDNIQLLLFGNAMLNTDAATSTPAGLDSLTLRDWRSVIEERKVLNGALESYLQRFTQDYNSADRLRYTKIELLTYGWWNCLNSAILRVEPREKIYHQFP